jgi:hypothetical protein
MKKFLVGLFLLLAIVPCHALPPLVNGEVYTTANKTDLDDTVNILDSVSTDVSGLHISTQALQTKIDNLNTSVVEYFMTSSTSSETGYFILTSTVLTNGRVYRKATVNATTVVVSTFVTLVGEPNRTFIREGVWKVNFNAYEVGTRDIWLFGDVYKRAYPSGTETFLFSTPLSEEIPTSETSIAIPVATGTITMLNTDMLVLYIKARRAGGTGNPDVFVSYGGGIYGDLDLPAQSAANAVNNPLTENLDCNGSKLNNFKADYPRFDSIPHSTDTAIIIFTSTDIAPGCKVYTSTVTIRPWFDFTVKAVGIDNNDAGYGTAFVGMAVNGVTTSTGVWIVSQSSNASNDLNSWIGSADIAAGSAITLWTDVSANSGTRSISYWIKYWRKVW